MARPQKAGLDYFPLDVDIASDEKVEYIEAKHGVAGFGIFIHLLMMIYRNGYYVEWGERQLYVFSKRVNVDINSAQGSTASAENPQSKVKESIYVVVDKRARAQDSSTAENEPAEKQDDVAAIFDTFSNNIHPITGEIEADMLADLLSHYGKEWTVEAIKETALNHGTSVKYIKSILENWERNGFKAKKKGRKGNGRTTGADEEAGRQTTAGLERLKKDMEYADAHTVHPWDVPDGAGGNRGA